jgi:hypothetical protein
MHFTVTDDMYGGHLVGYVETTYAKLVECFGPPPPSGPERKITAMWQIAFEDGTVASVYDWKEGKTPIQAYDWSVSGENNEAVLRVAEALGGLTSKDSYGFA